MDLAKSLDLTSIQGLTISEKDKIRSVANSKMYTPKVLGTQGPSRKKDNVLTKFVK